MNITVYRNRVPKLEEDFIKAREYYLSHGVDITFNFIDSDVKGYQSTYTGSKWFLRGTQTLVQPLGDMTMFVFDQNEWEAPQGSKYPLRYDTPTGNCFLWNGKPFINVGYYPSTDAEGLVFIEIIHEIMHGLVRLEWLKGHPIQDVMDTYRMNNINEYLNPSSNFNEQWNILKPYMTPTVIITRQHSTEKETLGILEANTGGISFTCRTLELPWKDNKTNVSCIPQGTYQVIWSFSPRKFKYTYRVQNVPNRAGILFHSANYFTDLLGCIALGSGTGDLNKDGQVDIINSRITIAAFEQYMQKKPFTLHIRG